MRHMRILIDADACPVQKIVEEVAREYGLSLFIYADLSHQLYSDYGQVIQLDKENQSVDMAIFSDCRKGDIVVTQDYGLAALLLGKKAEVLNQNGRIFTEENIDRLLMRRHINAKIRRAGGKHPTHSRRKKSDDLKFRKALLKLIRTDER